METSEINVGLEGIVVAETGISNVEGDVGRLSYRGEPIEKLITESYLSVVFLLIFGRRPNVGEEQALQAFLLQRSELSASELSLLQCKVWFPRL